MLVQKVLLRLRPHKIDYGFLEFKIPSHGVNKTVEQTNTFRKFTLDVKGGFCSLVFFFFLILLSKVFTNIVRRPKDVTISRIGTEKGVLEQ